MMRLSLSEAVKAKPSRQSRQGEAVKAKPSRRSRQGEAVKAKPSRRSRQGEAVKAKPSRRSRQGEAVKAKPSRRRRHYVVKICHSASTASPMWLRQMASPGRLRLDGFAYVATPAGC